MGNLLLGYRPFRFLNSTGLFLALAFAMLVLAACDTAEERAEGHYQSGLAHLESGDIDRALIEFRNVFDLNPEHRDARAAFANAQRSRGLDREAYGQFLRLVEQFPDDLEGRVALAEMALETRNWEEVERHVTRAIELAPDDVKIKSIFNTLAYYKAVQADDQAAKDRVTQEAIELIGEDSDLVGSRQVLIDSLIRSRRFEEAIVEIDSAVNVSPDDLSLYVLKLSLLRQAGDLSGIKAQLELMVEQFPDNPQIKQSLIAYYVEQNDIDGAEAVLRQQADASDEVTETRNLLAFIAQYRGRDATEAELNKILEAGRLPSPLFRALLARLDFDKGNRDDAIAALVAASEGAERTPALRDLEVELARMYFQTGNSVAARQVVEKVLEEDGTHPGATKMKAAWLIEDDVAGDAIVMLREAISNAPQDADLMTLMAQAHEREGNRELMAEMLSLAVEASGNRPAETLRYARYLAANEQLLAAEDMVIDALRLSPQNQELLGALGSLHVEQENWSQAQGVVDRLNELGDETSKTLATAIEVQVLEAQERSDELVALLQAVSEDPNTKRPAQVSLFSTFLRNNGMEAALEYVDDLLAETPDDAEFKFLKAGVLVGLNRQDEARVIYRDLLEEDYQRTTVWVNLYRLALSNGDQQGASEILQEALGKMPDNPTLQVALADELVRAGNPDEAIDIYSGLYERNSNSIVIANNLASLLANHRDDAESLQRAYTVARRLRGSEVPALQDTYGWIAFRMGNIAESGPYLESAAQGMPQDPEVQYHYGKVLAAQGNTDAAIEQLKMVLTLVAEDDTSAYLDDVRAEIEKLQTPAGE